MTEETLQQLGLEPKESQLYLALLELGESTVLPIAKKANIKRTYCYDLLASLTKKGLVSYIEKNGRRRYSAEDPKRLEQILKNRLEQLRDILPELRSLYNQATNRPRVRFYEGSELAYLIANELARVKAYDAISSPDELKRVVGPALTELAIRASEKHIKVRELYTRTSESIPWQEYYRLPEQEIRFLPANVKLTTDFVMYEDTLVLLSYEREGHGIVIEDSNIVAAHKALFEVLWESCK
jgi:HTH-type transcriptional regulator, sugar sensing transcriptional regulator